MKKPNPKQTTKPCLPNTFFFFFLMQKLNQIIMTTPPHGGEDFGLGFIGRQSASGPYETHKAHSQLGVPTCPGHVQTALHDPEPHVQHRPCSPAKQLSNEMGEQLPAHQGAPGLCISTLPKKSKALCWSSCPMFPEGYCASTQKNRFAL